MTCGQTTPDALADTAGDHGPPHSIKEVTRWAAIIAVPTAVTGFYGQNVPYPGFSQPIGFWTSTPAIVVLSGLLYLVFRKQLDLRPGVRR